MPALPGASGTAADVEASGPVMADAEGPEAAAPPPAATGPLAEAPLPEILDPERTACEREGGRMVSGPGGFGRLCVQPTPDAGKACRASGDCSGHCLARGNVCAPLTPLMGCHDILLSAGQRVTQCIE